MCVLHFCSKIGDTRLNEQHVNHVDKLGVDALTLSHGHTQIDAGNDNIQRPKLASAKDENKNSY